jgi:di/tricarboxylate transporter
VGACTCVLFVPVAGGRQIPVEGCKHDSAKELGELKAYVAEARVGDGAKIVDKAVKYLDTMAKENEVQVLGLVRRGRRLPGTARKETINKGDLLVVQGSPEAIDQFVGAAGLEYAGSDKHNGLAAQAVEVMEVVVPEGARIVGRSALELRLLARQGVTLLGISRQGRRIRERVRKAEILAGDLLLLMGTEEQLPDVVDWLGCLPLAERGLEITQRSKAWLAAGVFAVGILAASLGHLDLSVALAGVVVISLVLRVVPLSHVYEAVEWPVIVLLGSMIPIGVAMERSGATALIADAIVRWSEGLPAVAVLAILMIVTMTLSDVLNNVATALIAAPVAVNIANSLGANPDAFLMAVAVAASCAFLTPIGHKNNTIIMGPGGYRFSDYWRMGLPLEVLVVAVSLPMIILVWPLF